MQYTNNLPDLNFQKQIVEKLSFLKTLGFSETIIRWDPYIYDEKEHPGWLFSFTNKNITIDLSIAWNTSTAQFFCTRGKDHFDFKSYMFRIKNDSLEQISHNFFPSGADGEAGKKHILDVVDLFSKHAQNELKPVLEGKKWIDVPYHWGPYK